MITLCQVIGAVGLGCGVLAADIKPDTCHLHEKAYSFYQSKTSD
jgi:hypothetical protein